MPTQRATDTERLFRLALLALLVFLAIASGLAAIAETRVVLPGVARASGVGGSRFVSTVWLHNPWDEELPVELALVTAGGPREEVRVTLGPRETRRLDDPVGALFALDSAAGSLIARGARPFLLRGTTANVADPRGTYGLALAALPESDALRPGEIGTSPWLTNTAAAAGGFRTNVAVTLLGSGGEVLVTLVDDSGLVRGEERVLADGPLFWQRPVSELASDPEVPLGRVEVRVLRGAAVAYTAVVDNVTGDGILALARGASFPAGSLEAPFALLVDGAARVPGANGTLWRTGLRLVNPGLSPVEVELESATGGGNRVSRVVAPRGILEETDLLGALGLPEGSAGAVRVTSSGRLAALASTRNVDPSGRPGTYAASQEPIAAGALAGSGRTLVFTGLSADDGASGFRTNVALLAGTSGARGRLLLRAPAGSVVASGTFELSPSTWTQRSLAAWVPESAAPRDGTLEVAVDAGSLDAYASVIDNGTGDPVVLAATALPVAACPPQGAAPVLAASAPSVLAGTAVTLRLDAPGRGPGRLVPGGLALAPGGNVSVTPAVTTTFRWVPTGGCPEDVSGPVTVVVAAPQGAVMTEGGAVSGTVAGASVSFKGIPLAAPPTGPLRWRPPAPPEPWIGVRDGSAFGPVCPQPDDTGAVIGAEACLTLNVWKPASPPADPLPVLFFIHGGGNAMGASSFPFYDGSLFAGTGRAVVVTVNYRLSSFGWLAQPYLSAETRRGVSGNYGTLDQLAALRWVRRNAAAFGGDPARVAIFGESAGGVNVCALVASPLAKGLFSAAIMESGGCGQRPIADSVTFGNSITDGAGCAAAADPAACMRARPFEAVVMAVPPVVSITAANGQIWGPAVDGFVLRDSPDVAMGKGEHNKVPFVVGANADETGQVAPPIASEAEYRALLASQFGVLAPLVLAQYPMSAYPTPRKAYVAVTTDARFVCPSRRHVRAAAQGGSRAFRYFFSYPASRLYGAIHGVELPFLFGTLSTVAGYTPDATARALSDAMNAAWAHVGAAGDPGPAWPLYDATADRTYVWDAVSGPVDGIRTGNCNFWDAITIRR